MKPFRDYELRNVITNQWAAVHKKIDGMSNDEIMANDLEILAENIYQEFFIEPVTIFEEDFSRRSIRQGKIQRYPNRWTHHVMIGNKEEIDDELLSWIEEAAGFAERK